MARRLGFAVGLYHVRDWARIRREHTPHEWIIQRMADRLDPIGEHRADMRSGAAVQQLLRKLVPGITPGELEEVGEFARNYLTINQPRAGVLMPEEAAAIKGET